MSRMSGWSRMVGVGLLCVLLWIGAIACAPSPEATVEGSTPTSVALPIEEIQPASGAIALEDRLVVDVLVGLPSGCHAFESLAADVDRDRQTVAIAATGTVTGDFCTEIYQVHEASLAIGPLPTAGMWTLTGQRFDDTVAATVEVTGAEAS